MQSDALAESGLESEWKFNMRIGIHSVGDPILSCGRALAREADALRQGVRSHGKLARFGMKFHPENENSFRR